MTTAGQAHDGRARYLIAFGASRYKHPCKKLPDLPETPQELETVARGFAKIGYQRILDEDGRALDADVNLIRERVTEFFCSKDRHGDEVVVFYFTGHGGAVDGIHYLWPSGGRLDNPQLTAIAPDDLAKWMLEGSASRSRPESILVILDTCFAEEGAARFVQAFSSKHRRRWTSKDRGMVVLSAGRTDEYAKPGALANALFKAIDDIDDKDLGDSNQEYFYIDGVKRSIQRQFDKENIPQRVARDIVAEVGDPPFFPNPRYSRHYSGVNLEVAEANRQAAMSQPSSAASSDSGIAASAADHFTGRTAALRGLVNYLHAGNDPAGLCIVTGSPGSGKSALLRRLVSLADKEERSRLESTLAPNDPVPNVGEIDVFLHLRGLPIATVWSSLAKELTIDARDCQSLISGIESASRVHRIVVDALDESLDPDKILKEVLVPLGELSNVRLIVGTRPIDSTPSTAKEQEIDLDSGTYFESADVKRYVVERMQSNVIYRDKPIDVDRISDEVTKLTEKSFLVASIVARELARAKAAIDTHESGWESKLPGSLDEAFESDLMRYERHGLQRARDLLLPLAYSQGYGIPQEDLWVKLASRLSGRQYASSDISWLRRELGFYIKPATDSGRSVYRLYHEKLAECLRRNRDSTGDEQDFFDVLMESVPRNAEQALDWAHAHPYVKGYLAVHARRTGKLASLLEDLGYVVNANPAILVEEIFRDPKSRVKPVGRVYGFAAHRFGVDSTTDTRAAMLALVAMEDEEADLAKDLDRFIGERNWRPLWSHPIRRSPHRVLAKLDSTPTCLAMGNLDGDPVVVAGSVNGIRIWDARTGKPRGVGLKGQPTYSVAWGDLDDTSVVISGGGLFDKTIRIWDARTGTPRGAPLEGHAARVTSVAWGELDGTPVVISGSEDQTVRIWDARTGTPRGVPLEGHTAKVTSVAWGELDGAPAVISGSEDATVRIWDARTGMPHGVSLEGNTEAVTSVAWGDLDGDPVVVAGSDNGIRIWDARTGKQRDLDLKGRHVASVAWGELDGTPVVISGGGFFDKTIRIWDARTGALRGAPLEGHTEGVNSVAWGELDGTPLVISGSEDATVRIWDARMGVLRGVALEGHINFVRSVACGELDGTPVVISGGTDKSVYIWDARTGTPRGAPLEGHTGYVDSVAWGELDGTPVVISGSWDNTVRIWDARTGAPRGAPLEGHADGVASVAWGELDGTPVVISGSGDATVRIWDARTGTPRGVPLEGHTKGVACVAWGELDGTPVVISGGGLWDKTIRIWDARTGMLRGAPLEGHTRRVDSVAWGELDGTPVVISGSEDETVRIWDARAGTPCGAPLEGHTRFVRGVVWGELDGMPTVISGSVDGTLRFWHLRKEECALVLPLDNPIKCIAIDNERRIVVARENGLTAIQLPRNLS